MAVIPLFQPHVGWVAAIRGIFAIVWGLLRTGVVISILHQTFKKTKEVFLTSLFIICLKGAAPLLNVINDWISSASGNSTIVRASFRMQ
jgi:hypothetical protein